jgi:ADP-ribose pyrophosphatase
LFEAGVVVAKDKIVNSREIYHGRVVRLWGETVQTPQGTTYEREVIRHNGAVAMLPIEPDGTLILVTQYRAGSDSDLLEIPAGTLNPGEDREECARRELQEEIGMAPGKLTKLGEYWVAASYTSEVITIYIAEDLRPSKLPADLDENLTLVRIPFDEALRMGYSNEIVDGKTLIGLAWAAKRWGKIG